MQTQRFRRLSLQDSFRFEIKLDGLQPPASLFAAWKQRPRQTPRLMQLRRLVIGEVERFPELGAALHKKGPGRSINRLAKAFTHYRKKGQIAAADVRVAASFFNWLVMGEPVNNAMLLGDQAIPNAKALRRHAEESVRIFLSAYGAMGKKAQ